MGTVALEPGAPAATSSAPSASQDRLHEPGQAEVPRHEDGSSALGERGPEVVSAVDLDRRKPTAGPAAGGPGDLEADQNAAQEEHEPGLDQPVALLPIEWPSEERRDADGKFPDAARQEHAVEAAREPRPARRRALDDRQRRRGGYPARRAHGDSSGPRVPGGARPGARVDQIEHAAVGYRLITASTCCWTCASAAAGGSLPSTASSSCRFKISRIFWKFGAIILPEAYLSCSRATR